MYTEIKPGRVQFHTNRDSRFGWKFPESVAVLPKIGDLIQCKDGDYMGEMKVCRIVHTFTTNDQPIIKIELTIDTEYMLG